MGIVIVTAPDSITIRSITEFGKRLDDVLEGANEVVIDAAALSEVDLSFIQLILAARTYAEQEGSRFGMAQSAGPALAALLDRAGFLGDPQPADLDFWFHGEFPQ